MRWLLLIVCLLSPVAAQPGFPADPCPLGTAVGTLEGRNVRARLFNNGNLFYGPGYTNGDGYEVPTTGEDAGKGVFYSGALWLAGRVGGEIRASASRYALFPFRPGLAGPDGTPPTPAECADADRIWVVSRDDVAAYLTDGTLTDDLRDWPAHLGAPVIDGDGVEGNYDLAAGDQPAIRGDVTAFWTMTDTARPEYTATGLDGAPLGVDVAVEAFAFRGADPSRPLATTTGYRYTVTNRSGLTIRDLYGGLFADWDLGAAPDDYIGTDTTRAMGFVYNGSNDDGGTTGYGVPPAAGAVLVDSPAGADGRPLGLTGSRTFYNGVGPEADPSVPIVYWYTLRGLFGDGTPMRARGSGYGSQNGAPLTTFMFPGDPLTPELWSERNYDGNGTATSSGDRRVSLGSGPLTLAPDASVSWTWLIIFAQGDDYLDSVVRLRGNAEQMHALHAAGVFEPSRVGTLPAPPPPVELAVRRPAPNPFAGTTALALRGLAGEAVTLTVADVLGRVVERRALTPAADDVDVSLGAGLAPGVYVVRVAGRGFDLGFPVVKSR